MHPIILLNLYNLYYNKKGILNYEKKKEDTYL